MIRILFALVLIFGLDLYVFSGLQVALSSLDSSIANVVFGVYWMLSILAIIGAVAALTTDFRSWGERLKHYLKTFFFMIYLSKFLMLIILFLDDIRRLILMVFQGAVARPESVAIFAVLFGVVPLLVLTYGMLRNTYRFKLTNSTLTLDDLPKALVGLKIIQISDIHVGSFIRQDKVVKAIEDINNQNPDIVFFTGDLVNSIAAEMNDWISVFGKIRAKYGVYSIVGNHDYGDYTYWPNKEAKRANFNRLKEIHAEMGWQLLLNDHAIVEIEGCKLAVVGVENYSANRRFHKYGDLAKAANGTEHADFKVLLSHDPSHWDDQVIKDFQDIRITFSGHTHGFQFGIDLPWFKWSPSKYFYKQWAGLYEESGQFLYVNRGFGVLGYRGRIGVLPEITVIKLLSY